MKNTFPILLAEDDENDAFFVKRAFTAARVSNPLVIVNDGQQAIDYLSGNDPYTDRSKHPLPGLLILDLKMPYKTGHEVLQWLKDQPKLCRLPTIIWSSSLSLSDIDLAYQLGANAFITKPSSMEDTSELVTLIKRFWLDLNQSPSLTA